MVPVLTIAGSDSSGGAGIQADLKTFAANGTYGMSAITAVTAQAPGNFVGFEPVSAELLRQQLTVLFDNFDFGAIKTGMLATTELVNVVCQFLEEADPEHKIKLVVDPVMIATSGDTLLEPAAIESYRERLLPRATIATPNLPEAAALLEQEEPKSVAELESFAASFVDRFSCPVLLKGGHLPATETAADLLHDGTHAQLFDSERLSISGSENGGLHGTGCTLASALAARLARGDSLSLAAENAKAYLTETIRGHLRIGRDDEIPALDHFANR